MIHFSDRLKLQQEYDKWRIDNSRPFLVKDTFINAVCFLQINGIINENKLHEFCENIEVSK